MSGDALSPVDLIIWTWTTVLIHEFRIFLFITDSSDLIEANEGGCKRGLEDDKDLPPMSGPVLGANSQMNEVSITLSSVGKPRGLERHGNLITFCRQLQPTFRDTGSLL